MKNIVHILTVLASSILASSCIDAPVWEHREPMPSGEVRVNLNLHLPADYAPFATRAFDWQGEVNVSDAYILVFDGYDLLIDIKAADEIVQSGDGGQASFRFTLSTGGTRRLVVLGNSEAILQATIGTNRNSDYISWSYDSVMALIYSSITSAMYTGDPPGYIPMWGETGMLELTAGANTQDLRLMRAISRVDVGVGQVSWNEDLRRYTWNGMQTNGNPIPFRISSVTVVRPNNRLAVVPATANRTLTGDVTAVTIPYGTTAFTVAESMQNFTYNAVDGAVTNQIYIPEADVLMGPGARPGDANHTNRMALVVGGSFNGGPTTYYRLDFAPAGTLANPLRNHLYQFNIARVTSPGWSTVDEAYRQASLNISASVIPWNLNDMGNIVFDGSSYFSSSAMQVHFTPAGNQTATTTIRTNVPDFSMNLGGTTRLQAGPTMPVTYTDPATGFVYTLNRTGTDTYTLTVTTATANASATQTVRRNDWTFVAGRLNTAFPVDQAWANPYVSVPNGTTTVLYPEGTNNNPANNLPLSVASANPLTVSVTYSPTGAPTNWLHGIVSNPPLVNGVYSADMSLSVDPFVYGPNNTTNRTATINVTPQGGTPSVYAIVQQAPYIMLSPSNVSIPHPAAPTTVDTPVTVVTNILASDLATPPTQTSNDVGLTYQNAIVPYTLIGDVNSRDRQFIVRTNITQNAVNYTGIISSTFTVAPNSDKYGPVPHTENNATISVVPSTAIQGIYWNQIDFNQTPGTYQWKTSARYTDQSQTAVLPWNATKVDVDVVSNMRPEPDPTMGTTIAPMTPASTDRGNGTTAYAWEYTIPPADYSLGGSNTIRFNSTYPPGVSSTLTFRQGVQYITRDGGTVGTVDYRGTTGTQGQQAAITLRSNVNWSATVGSYVPPITTGAEWISMSVDNSAYSPNTVTRDDRLIVPAYTTGYYLESRDLLAAPHTISFYVTPVPDFNPASGFVNGIRTATLTFTNNSYDASAGGRRGAANPAPIQIVQYAPTLVHAASTLPAGNDRITAAATTYTFSAITNLQGWGVRAYDGPYAPGKTPLASQDFTPQNPGVTINSTAPGQVYNTTLSVPGNPSITNSRTVYFYYHSNEFPNRDPATMLIGAYNQDFSSPNVPPTNGGGGGDFIFFDAGNRMQVGNIADGSVTVSFQNRNFSSNLGYFKFGSAIGFDGNGVWGGQFGATTGTIKFNPITSGRTIASYRDIPAFNNQENPAPSTAPGTYIGDQNYNTFANLREFGQHDPCRLVGYTATEVRSWTEAQYNTAMAASRWRIATAMENAYLVGGTGARTFDPTNPPTNWTRSTVFNNTWTAIYGYGYHQGTGPNDWNYEVMNQQVAQIGVPVVPGGQPLNPSHWIMGNSIRYAPTGQLGLDVPLQVNFWSGTVAYSSYDTGQLGYGVVRVPTDGNLYPSFQRHVDFGMPVRCIRR